MKRKTPLLRAGDAIAIVAPAGSVDKTKMLQAQYFLEQQGFHVLLGKHFASTKSYFSGTIKQRLADFQWALDHPDVKAIFCARGGYGSVELIDQLDFSFFEKHPKWVVGFSDITLFLNHLYSQYRVVGLHAPMPNSYATTPMPVLEQMLGALSSGKIHHPKPFKASKQAGVEGVLWGGNLSLIASMMGSNSLPNPKNTILFLEDVGEYQYHIHRLLMMLKRAGYLGSLKGLVIGSFTDIKDTAKPFGKSLNQMIQEVVSEYDYPLYFGLSSGHIDHNLPLFIGAKTKITPMGIWQSIV